MVIVTTWTGQDVRALRHTLGLTQPDLADRLGINARTVKRWEAGEPVGPEGQRRLGVELGRLSTVGIEEFRQRRGETDMDRRQLLRSAGAFGLAAAGADALAVPAATVTAGRPDAAAVAAVRQTLHAAMLLDDQLGSPAAAGLAQVQQALTESMLTECTPDLRPDLLSLRAEWLSLGGNLAWDRGDHAAAAQLYEDARETAHDAADDDLAAYALCHLSQLAISQRRPRIAMDHAVAARAWVSQSQDRRLRAYVGLRLAEAAGLNGQRGPALSALDQAERDLSGLQVCTPPESRAYFVNAGLLESYRSSVLTNLGDAAPATTASRAALDAIPPEFTRDRAVTMLELAQPLIRLDAIDEAAAVIGEAAALTERNRSPRLAASVCTARHSLAPWADSRAVRMLDEHLAGRDMVRA